MTLKNVKRYDDDSPALSVKTITRSADFLRESLDVNEGVRASAIVRASEFATLK